MNKLYFKSIPFLATLLLLVVIGCEKDPDPVNPTVTDPIASFQYEISADNFLEVKFSNFSQNATSYSWDFGDGNTSADESPTYTYAAAGDYTVTLTATGEGGNATKSESFSLTDPDSELARLAGATSKTWYLQREGIALGIGPVINDNGWWSFGGATPLGDRPCILNDAFTFHRDGTWEHDTGGDVFIDAEANGGWLGAGVDEGCYDEAGNLTSAAGDDLSAFANGGDYSFEYDAAAGTITLLGAGAYIGLPVKTAAGDNYIPINSKTYDVFKFSDGDVADSLQMTIVGDGFAWNFYLVSYHNPADLPDLPSAMPTAGFTYTKDLNNVEFTNTSKNSTNYSWDFGDGNSSTDENPTHTYAADGDYTVTLTAMDDMGGSNEASEVISISSAKFTAAALSNADGKVWKLDGEGSYIVGPTPNSGEWWGGVDAQGVIDRACQFDDEYIFTDGGVFEYDSKGDVWGEGHMGVADACVADGDLSATYTTLGSGTHAFTATDNAITVTGNGAFIGFNKPFNGGELDGMLAPVDEITYEVIDYSNNAGVERLTITIDYSAGQVGGAYWTMKLISQ